MKQSSNPDTKAASFGTLDNDDTNNNNNNYYWREKAYYTNSHRTYALSGRIMLWAIIFFFFVLFLVVCLHIYARYLLQRRRRHLLHLRRSRRLRRLPATDAAARGLHPSLLSALPVFAFSAKAYPDPLDCAICLTDFQDLDTGRLLPSCNHRFHAECVDLWFRSHSTCPLCRSPVTSAPSSFASTTASAAPAVHLDPSSETDPPRHGSNSSSSSSSILSRSSSSGSSSPSEKVEVLERGEEEAEAAVRSPMSALRRMLSIGGAFSGGGSGGGVGSSVAERDLERGDRDYNGS